MVQPMIAIHAGSRVLDHNKIAKKATIPPKTSLIINNTSSLFSINSVYTLKGCLSSFLKSPGFAPKGIIE